ncbi:RNA polymerase sigma factor [Sphingosinicella rhizophila]|uniref:RNA polymerase sigma factor n=1 Tax=Sphingosinicella rhizophila TaxID=3050082 RepID=UPI0028E21748|nr:RNA polymerase sigma factor [Sphingosinicella sp. GR2756]
MDRWFLAEVLPLEAALVRFLKRHWRDPHEIADLRQEVYARCYSAALNARPLQTKPFVFATARNLLIDKARRRRIVSLDLVADFEGLNVTEQDLSAEARLEARDQLRQLRRAIASLPPRCREVIMLRKIEGLPQRAIAERMGIAEGTVETQVCKGVKMLAERIFGEDRQAAARADSYHEHANER